MRGLWYHQLGLLALAATHPAPTLLASDDVLSWLYPELVPDSLAVSAEDAARDADPDPGQPEGLERFQWDGQARVRCTPGSSAFVNLNDQELAFSHDLVLAPGLTVPRHLHLTLAGATWAWTADGGSIGIHADAGSASDRPFADRRVAVADATLFARLPAQGHDSWVFLLNEDNDRSYLRRIPLPAIAYEHHPTPDFDLMLGLPVLSLSWKATPWLLIEGSWLENANLDLYAYCTRSISLSLSYAWYSQGFLIDQAPFDGRQVVISDMHACAGVSWDASASITVRLLGGWLFARQAYSDEHYLGLGRPRLVANLPNTPLALLTFDLN